MVKRRPARPKRELNQPEPEQDADTISRPALGSLAALFVLAGQLALFAYPGRWAWGLGLSLVGIACFLWARLGPPFRWATRLVGGVPLTVTRLMVFIAVLFSVTATWFGYALERAGRTDFAPVLALWAAAGLSLLAGFGHGTSWPADLRQWLQDNRRELLTVGAVVLLGFTLRFYKLGVIPQVVEGDGGRIGQAALTTVHHPMANPFSVFESMGGLYLQGIALAMRAFGRNLFALRLLPAIGGSLAIPAVYLLGRRLFGPRVALFAAVLLACSHSHLHFSRTVAVSYTQGTFLVPIMLYFLLTGLENRSSLRMAAAAVVLGIHFSIYIDSVIFAAYALVFMLVAWAVARPLLSGRRAQVVAFVVSAAIMMLPQAQYAFAFPDEYLGRFRQDGVVESGWLEQQMVETGRSAPLILAGRVIHAFLALSYYPAEDFYGTRIPLLHFMTAGLFLIGVSYSVWRTRDHRHLLVNGYLFGSAFAVGLTAIPPSADSYRMLIALPAAMLLAGLGLDQLLQLIANPAGRTARNAVALGSVVLLTISTLNLKTYFVDFPARCRYGGDPSTRFASYLGEYLSRVDPSANIMLLADDYYRYGTHGSVDFLSGGLEVRNIEFDVDELDPEPNMVIIAPPTRADELRYFAEDHPEGALDLEYDCETLILVGYQMP